MLSNEVRNLFFDYFKSKDHTYVPGTSVIPQNDPSLLFVNSGMNQFKSRLLGQTESEITRVYNDQKCVRAGGKHNDLDDVGKDTYHHTFFMMLGQWSFGDYGKKEAISYGWDLLTQHYHLSPDRLYVTYFEGTDQLEPDHETRKLWSQYLPESHIVPGSFKDNFWEMGSSGPCGPCTEIHYDRIGGREVPMLVNKDDPNVLEVWNIVFMQHNRDEGGVLTKLDKLNVDTGMGFERLVSILQDKSSNYDTDIFKPFLDQIETLSGLKYTGKVDKGDFKDMSFRVIADHLRTLMVCLLDGVTFGNNGRESVLRRIYRRNYLYGTTHLGLPNNFTTLLMQKLLPYVRSVYSPQSKLSDEEVVKIIEQEDQHMRKSLGRGFRKCSQTLEKLVKDGQTTLSGSDTFKLYATHGFPLELIEIYCQKYNVTLDRNGYDQCVQDHQTVSKAK